MPTGREYLFAATTGQPDRIKSFPVQFFSPGKTREDIMLGNLEGFFIVLVLIKRNFLLPEYTVSNKNLLDISY